MTVLVDSNIFIDFWKHPTEELIRFFSEQDAAYCNVIAAELLQGAVSEKNIREMTDSLKNLVFLSLGENIWEQLGQLLYDLRIHGITVPFQDVVIALVAAENDVPLFSNDSHFEMIQKVLPELKLYEVK